MKLETLIKSLREGKVEGGIAKNISSIAYDSRKVEPNGLFVAIKGMKTDGHAYLESAAAKGAAAVVVEDEYVNEMVTVIRVPDTRQALAKLSACFYDYPAQKLDIIGVTGTNGKTTTTHMIAEVLKSHGQKTGIMGTLYIKIGDKTYPTHITTPESLEIQKHLAMMVDEGVKTVVMEVSSHGLYFDRVYGITFLGGIFTNITRDHLDFHNDMESYFQEKLKLFKRLKSEEEGGFALLNSDDVKTPQIVEALQVPYMSYGIYRLPHIRAKNIKTHITGTTFIAESDRWDVPVKMNMTGMFNVYNALAAVGTGLFLNITPAAITKGLENLKGVPGRFETINEGQDFGIVVDYAHTPDGIKNVLQSARVLTNNRLIIVFGCGGDRDRTKRPIMGKYASELADMVIVTSDNPRTEDPMAIIADILPGIEEGNAKNIVEADRKTAIYTAINAAQKGDIVVIAGKGHETYQIFKDKTITFNDLETAREAVLELK